MAVGGKHIDRAKKKVFINASPFFYWASFPGCFFHNNPEAKFMQDSNHIVEKSKKKKKKTGFSHRHKTQLHFSLMYCNWNTSVTCHKQGDVSFPKRKLLSRSTVNSTDTNCSKDLQESGPCLQRYTAEFNSQSLCEKVNFMSVSASESMVHGVEC